MTGKLKILFVFCGSLLILFILRAYSFRELSKYKDSSGWVNHTQDVISKMQDISSYVKDLETSQRGYVIVAQDKYLFPYQNALKNIDSSYLQLLRITKDNTTQQQLLDSLHPLLQEKIAFVKKVFSAREEKGFDSARALVLGGTGEDIKLKIQEKIDRFIYTERQLLTMRLQKAEESFQSTLFTIVLSVILSLLLVVIGVFIFLRDYNKRVALEKKLQEDEMRTRKFLDSLPLGVFIIDSNRKPFYANSKSAEQLGQGIKAETFVKDLPELYQIYKAGTNELFPVEHLPIIRALGGEKNVIEEDIEIRSNGKAIRLRVSATAITNTEDKIEYAISVSEDITAVKEASQNLINAKQLAENAVNLKDVFLANVSHEIRTPMNSIIGFTDILLKRNLGAQENDYVKTIKISGENLLRIINDILDISKIETHMMTFEEHPLGISDVFKSLQAMFAQKAAEKEIGLSFVCDDTVPGILMGDTLRLTQIIINLVGNAIKFTAKGSVDVMAKVILEEKNSCLIGFSVKDTGIGIPADKQKFVFERFRQAETDTTRNYGGTGLGLSIAKQLVEAQGGQLSLQSTPGVGSVFTFSLPFKKSSAAGITLPKIDHAFNIAELGKLSILVAEDNPINVKFVQSLFAEHGLKADIAVDGKKAVEMVKAKHYDLLLMDIEMPGMNGYDATTIIHKELKKNIPIIAMTANALAGEKEKCLLLGMADYISKPINADLLFEKMYHATIGSKNGNGTAAKEIDLAFLVKSMRGKKEVIRENIDMLLTHLPEDMQMLGEAISKADHSAIKKMTHKLKSTASIMGAAGITGILEKMELLSAKASGMEEIVSLHQTLDARYAKAVKELQKEKLSYM